jgi:putative FmdB family regulatory protein
MPTYEYRCNDCQNEFETEQRIKDAPLKDCPKCGKPALERLISATAFQLKGGGWYKDLYSSSNGKNRSDNQVADRLSKAIDDDKKKTSASSSSSGESAKKAD